jgi:hypothetical protein
MKKLEKVLLKIKETLELFEVCECYACRGVPYVSKNYVPCGENYKTLKLLENRLWMILQHEGIEHEE